MLLFDVSFVPFVDGDVGWGVWIEPFELNLGHTEVLIDYLPRDFSVILNGICAEIAASGFGTLNPHGCCRVGGMAEHGSGNYFRGGCLIGE